MYTAKDSSRYSPLFGTVGRGPTTSKRIYEKMKGRFVPKNLLFLCTDANNSYKNTAVNITSNI